ncbi:DNA-binding response regulator [Arthrobacter cheniae]|uniref:DNA-binding response regulator n=1 Tax=Arthrobacter cheniae TaxID=1258888 RepID=A0A3A5LYV5_9MICC|nr:response regulator transcription factor [Arthrobacter cheniae]RJT75103.1 DNA-binding response regulator [Arthrobacter cheniae]
MSHILIAEDDPHVASFIKKGLQAAGYSTEHAADGETALFLARASGFDLIILDIGLPLMDGFKVLAQIRGEGVRTPVIVLTARDSVPDTVAGLEGGANDYMTKPFDVSELLARIRLRLVDRAPAADGNVIKHKGLSLDLHSRRARIGEESVELTSREFAILEVFLRHPDRVISREQLLSQVWGYDFDPGSNVVDVYVRALRAKIGAERIETIRGAGYRLP